MGETSTKLVILPWVWSIKMFGSVPGLPHRFHTNPIPLLEVGQSIFGNALFQVMFKHCSCSFPINHWSRGTWVWSFAIFVSHLRLSDSLNSLLSSPVFLPIYGQRQLFRLLQCHWLCVWEMDWTWALPACDEAKLQRWCEFPPLGKGNNMSYEWNAFLRGLVLAHSFSLYTYAFSDLNFSLGNAACISILLSKLESVSIHLSVWATGAGKIL